MSALPIIAKQNSPSVSFTLLMTNRCDSNPAQYERNRGIRHLIHALG
ncbi:hypothetical protein T06_12969 [Trichinella sp. T6]|nr:hypothetical protein T06_12969 [Trichinella sp. T6]